MGDTDLTPYDGGTVGSQTSPRMFPQIRNAAATAREMLLDLAARKWNVGRDPVPVANGKVTSGSHTAGFGELTQGQKLVRTIPSSAPVAPPAQWKVAGTSVPKVAGREIVTGAHKYPYDIVRPGMLHGKVLYPPQFGAKLASLDKSAAEAMPGVKVVHEVLASPRAGFGADVVGVVAPDPETASKALAALRAEWTHGPAQPSSKEVHAYFKQNASGPPTNAGRQGRTRGPRLAARRIWRRRRGGRGARSRDRVEGTGCPARGMDAGACAALQQGSPRLFQAERQRAAHQRRADRLHHCLYRTRPPGGAAPPPRGGPAGAA